MEERVQIREGMTIYSADLEKLGKVVRCNPTTFVIEKGFFFPRDYVARYEDVSRISGDDGWLQLNARDIASAADEGAVQEEEVEVRKRPVVRDVYEEQRTASGTVRREEVDVDRDEADRAAIRKDEDPNTRR
jgi:hypothetical protein